MVSWKLFHVALLNGFEIATILSFFLKSFLKFSQKEKKFNAEHIEDFRKVQRQNYYKIARVSLKSLSSNK